jgi:hypothetical protein
MRTGNAKLARNGLCALTAAASLAVAQPSLAAPGEGIQVGDSTTIRLRLGTGLEFRSNAYRAVGARQSAFSGDSEIPAFNFALVPGIGINVSTSKVRFAFDGEYLLRKFFESELAQNLDQFSNFRIKARLDALPDGVVGFHIQDVAAMVNRADDHRFFDNSLLTQLRNELQGGLTFRVGPEFSVDANVAWAYHNFRVPGVDGQNALNDRNTIRPGLGIAWRFFPKTAFVVEAHVDLNRWTSNWIPTNETVGAVGSNGARSYGQFLAMPDSTHVKGTTGIRGRFTDHLTVAAMVGYGTALYSAESVAEESAANPGINNESDAETIGFDANVRGVDGILALARVQVDLGHTKKRRYGQMITVQYRKDFADSFFTNFLHTNHVSGQLQSRWGRYVTSRVGGGARFEQYSGEVDRRDVFLDINGGFVIQPVTWLGFDLGARWMQRASSQTEVQYDNVLAHLMLQFRY